MKQWITDALQKLTLEEFDKVIVLAQKQYHRNCKIVAANRLEGGTVRVTVQLAGTHEKKIITLTGARAT